MLRRGIRNRMRKKKKRLNKSSMQTKKKDEEENLIMIRFVRMNETYYHRYMALNKWVNE